MKFHLIEKQTVEHTYYYEVEIPDYDGLSYMEAISQAQCAAIPDNARHESKLISSDTDCKCAHENQYVNDRSQFVCKDCNEELGR